MAFWKKTDNEEFYNEEKLGVEKTDMNHFIDEISNANTTNNNGQSSLQMKVSRPRVLKDATEIAESLLAGQTVVLNLDEMEDSDARRMLDYIAGITYAIKGKIERPADRTFLITPNGVKVATEQKNN